MSFLKKFERGELSLSFRNISLVLLRNLKDIPFLVQWFSNHSWTSLSTFKLGSHYVLCITWFLNNANNDTHPLTIIESWLNIFLSHLVKTFLTIMYIQNLWPKYILSLMFNLSHRYQFLHLLILINNYDTEHSYS
jgi:hypothetical protein